MGKKNSIYVIKIHTNRDQTLNIYTKRPASPTCNLYGSLPRRRGEGAARGGGGVRANSLLLRSYRCSRWLSHTKGCWNSSLVRCPESM